MARILVISDNEQDTQVMQAATAGQEHYMQCVASGLAGCVEAVETRPDVVVVGERTTDQPGLSVLQQLRETLDTDSLLVMKLDTDSVDARKAAYVAGADDTLSRPLDVAEVSLRLRALLRRIDSRPVHDRLTAGPLVLNLTTCQLYVAGRRIPVTPNELALLTHLMATPGRTYNSEALLQEVWGCYPGTGDPAMVRNCVRKLRQKIEDDPAQPRYLKTVNRFGYRVIG